jgi:iron complex transport system permease protein
MADAGAPDPVRRRFRAGSATLLSLQMAGLVAVLFLISLAVGPVRLSIGQVFSGLFGGGGDSASVIVQDIRLPRTLLAMLIGGTLGLAGAALQGLLKSPLAAPSLLGAPSAAAFAAVAAIALGLVGALSAGVPIAAIIGALASVGLLLLVAGPRASLLVLILAGLAVSALAAAGTALALNLAPGRFDDVEISFWLLGSLENRSMQHVAIALPFMAMSWLLLTWDRGAFRALTLGEEAAEGLGINMRAVRQRVVLGVAAGVGAAVAVAGSIGFVGLVAPQLMRPFVNHDPARVLVPAALTGAALLLIADIIVRLVPSAAEIKVGIVTALIGAPVFIFLIMQQRRGLVGAPM